MEGLTRLAVRRPVAVVVVALAVVLIGQVAWRQLPIDLLPDLQSPTVLVSVRSGDRPPLEMERLFGEQVEQRLFTVAGIRAVEQVARTGRLVTRVTFEWGSNMDLAVVEVQKVLGSIEADPEVDEVVVRRFDPRQLPVLALGLVAPSGRPDLAELKRVARRQLAPTLEQLDGVAQVRVIGGRDREVQVRLDRHRLEAFGVTLREVESRLQSANLDVNAGTLEERDRVFLVRGLARFTHPEDVGNVVVRFVGDSLGGLVPLRVSDLAEVILADAEIESLVRVDGQEGVGLEVYTTPRQLYRFYRHRHTPKVTFTYRTTTMILFSITTIVSMYLCIYTHTYIHIHIHIRRRVSSSLFGQTGVVFESEAARRSHHQRSCPSCTTGRNSYLFLGKLEFIHSFIISDYWHGIYVAMTDHLARSLFVFLHDGSPTATAPKFKYRLDVDGTEIIATRPPRVSRVSLSVSQSLSLSPSPRICLSLSVSVSLPGSPFDRVPSFLPSVPPLMV